VWIGRNALSALGPVAFERRAWRCADPCCGAFVAPVDRELGLEPKVHATAGAREKIALVGATESYREAEMKLACLAGLKASWKTIQKITCGEGERAAELLAGQQREARKEAARAQRHDTLVVEMDGTCVLTQRGGPRPQECTKAAPGAGETDLPEPGEAARCRGKEVKCATVFGLDHRVAPPARPAISHRRYAASPRGIDAFAATVFALALACGARKARRIAVIGDGADWIWNWSAKWLAEWKGRGTDVVEIVDFWHAAERLSTLSKAVFGEGSEAARSWLDKWRRRLKEGGIDDVIGEIESLASQWKGGKRHDACAGQRRYFAGHRERMRYDKFAEQGLPIGSGAIEGTCKNLVKKRMSASGMHWSPDLIEPVVALRTVLFNGDWRELYPQAA